MKTIAETLEVARSNIIERAKGDCRSRGPQIRPGDVELAADIRQLVDQRPTYGYRRIAALLKRERRSAGQEPVNAKRVYRLMRKHGLLERHARNADDGCSDYFSIESSRSTRPRSSNAAS